MGLPSLRKNRTIDLYEFAAAEVLRYEKKLYQARKRYLESRFKMRDEIKRLQA